VGRPGDVGVKKVNLFDERLDDVAKLMTLHKGHQILLIFG
jgi:hypothetical protein